MSYLASSIQKIPISFCSLAILLSFSFDMCASDFVTAVQNEIRNISSKEQKNNLKSIDKISREFPIETDWLNQSIARPQVDNKGRSKALLKYFNNKENLKFLKDYTLKVINELKENGKDIQMGGLDSCSRAIAAVNLHCLFWCMGTSYSSQPCCDGLRHYCNLRFSAGENIPAQKQFAAS